MGSKKMEVIVGFMVLMAIPSLGWGGLFGEFDRFMGTFNPADTIYRPVEDKIPGLDLRGFIWNLTDFNVHSRKSDYGLGHRELDWDVQGSQWLGKFELQYEAKPNLRFYSVNEFLWDAAYDWQESDGLFGDEVDRYAEYFDRAKYIVRELYFDWYPGDWQIKLGKQQVVWGKMDGKVIDIINPEDLRETVQHSQVDYDYRRTPTWMASIKRYFGASSINLLWIPDFEETRLPVFGSAWWPPAFGAPPSFVHIHGAPEHNWDFKNHEWGIRFDTAMGGLTWSVIYASLWDDFPTNFRRRFSVAPLSLDIEQEYTRLHHFGFAMDYGFRALGIEWVGRLESLYTLNKYIGTSDEPLSMDGVEKKNGINVTGALEWWIWPIPWQTNFLFQPIWIHRFGWDGDNEPDINLNPTGANRNDFIPVFSVWHYFHFVSERLSLTFTVYPWLGSHYNGTTARIDLEWKFSDWVTGKITYLDYSGASDDQFGMYDDYDNIGFEIKYNF